MSGQQPLVLFIDEEYSTKRIAELILTDAGYNVILFSNLAEGLEVAQKQRPAILFCSAELLNNDNYSIVKSIRANTYLREMLIVCLTNSMSENFHHGLQIGIDDYLLKPLHHTEVLKTIQVGLARRRHLGKGTHLEFIQSMNTLLLRVLPHEIRTPLNAIVGCIDYLCDEFINEHYEANEQIHYDGLLSALRLLSVSSNRLYTLCERLLLYAKLSIYLHDSVERQRVLDSYTESFNDNVTSIAVAVAEQYDRHNDVVIKSPQTEITIHIGSEFLFTLIRELMDNACKFSTPGTIITISIEKQDEYYVLSFQDEGRGMNDLELSSIRAFQQFEREKFEQQGLGLGLTLVEDIIKIFDGFMKIKSTSGGGTTVYIGLKTFTEVSADADYTVSRTNTG